MYMGLYVYCYHTSGNETRDSQKIEIRDGDFQNT